MQTSRKSYVAVLLLLLGILVQQAACKGKMGLGCGGDGQQPSCSGTGNNQPTTAPAAANAAASAQLPRFDAAADPSANNLVQRLWIVQDRGGNTAAIQHTTRKCTSPNLALTNLQCVRNSCGLQALFRFYGNIGCWHEEFRECAGNDDCTNDEVARVNSVFTNPDYTLADYMTTMGYEKGKPHSDSVIFTNSMFWASRKQRYTDERLNMLGNKFSLRVRHVIQGGDRTGFRTYVPYQTYLDTRYDPRRDFSNANDLMDAVAVERMQMYFEWEDYTYTFLKHLNPQGRGDFYNDTMIRLYPEAYQTPQNNYKIPPVVTRVIWRFDFVKRRSPARIVPNSFDNHGRKFLLGALVVHTKDQNHIFNMVLVWTGSDFTCWKLDRNLEPAHQPDKSACTKNRILWAGYYVPDPSLDI